MSVTFNEASQNPKTYANRRYDYNSTRDESKSTNAISCYTISDDQNNYKYNMTTGKYVDDIEISLRASDVKVNSGGGDDKISLGGHHNIFRAFAGNGTDTINIGGSYNYAKVNAGVGADTIFVNDYISDNNFTIINGGKGVDTVIFRGDLSDYTITKLGKNKHGEKYTLYTDKKGNQTKVASDVENVKFQPPAKPIYTYYGMDNTVLFGKDNKKAIALAQQKHITLEKAKEMLLSQYSHVA